MWRHGLVKARLSFFGALVRIGAPKGTNPFTGGGIFKKGEEDKKIKSSTLTTKWNTFLAEVQ